MATPKVSVVIPAYNAMAYLPETLNSVFKQTFQDFEIIIINDGSSDNIVDWVNGLTDTRIKLISQKNSGPSEARNTGIKHSQGEYIAFLDADDIWEVTKLEKQVLCLDINSEVGLVDTWISAIDTHGKTLWFSGNSYPTGNVWRKLIEQNILVSGSTAMIRCSCFDKAGSFDPQFKGGEDWDMWTRISISHSFSVIEESLVRYRQHPSSATKNFNLMEHDFIRVIEKIYQIVPSNLQWVKRKAYGIAYRSTAGQAYSIGQYQYAASRFIKCILYHPQLILAEGVAEPMLKSLIKAGLQKLNLR